MKNLFFFFLMIFFFFFICSEGSSEYDENDISFKKKAKRKDDSSETNEDPMHPNHSLHKLIVVYPTEEHQRMLLYLFIPLRLVEETPDISFKNDGWSCQLRHCIKSKDSKKISKSLEILGLVPQGYENSINMAFSKTSFEEESFEVYNFDFPFQVDTTNFNLGTGEDYFVCQMYEKEKYEVKKKK